MGTGFVTRQWGVGGVGRTLLRLTVGLREGEENVLEDGGKETLVVEWQEV